MDPNPRAALTKIVNKIVGLPTLPSVLENLNKVINNPNSSAKEVAKLISNDPALTAKILRVVNSAFYGFTNSITTVTHAISILGFNTIRNIVLSSTVFDTFNKGKTASGNFDRRDLFRHSVATGCAAKAVAARAGEPGHMLEEYFIGGLMHDIGKLIIDQYLHDDFERILKRVEKEQCLIKKAEEKEIGLSHCELGYMLMQKWNLSPALSAVVLHHHNPSAGGEHRRFCAIIHVADIIARSLQIGNGGDPFVPALDAAAWTDLGLSIEDFTPLLQESGREMEGAKVFMDFIQ